MDLSNKFNNFPKIILIINDKYIFYENLNKELHINLYNTYNQNKISYNDTLLDLIDNDNFLERVDI